MKIYIKRHLAHAGKWIYEGYRKAWESCGYEALYYNTLDELENPSHPYYIMAIDSDISTMKSLRVIELAAKAFVYVQPNTFPMPWGAHPNFQCLCPATYIKYLNNLPSTHLWTFGDDLSHHTEWKKVHSVPLAFDSIGYQPPHKATDGYDVCFVGGWANNGFNEKKKIMLRYFREFATSGLNCGFFVNKGLTHEQELAVLYNSTVALNIHDAYQRALGYDTNERTFKSLGLNGLLVSDKVGQLERIFPNVKTSVLPSSVVGLVKQYLSLTSAEIAHIKNKNIQNVLDNHCYTHRVRQFILM